MGVLAFSDLLTIANSLRSHRDSRLSETRKQSFLLEVRLIAVIPFSSLDQFASKAGANLIKSNGIFITFLLLSKL